MTICFDNDSLRAAVGEYLQDPTTCEQKYGDISTWDVSQVTDMSSMFEGGELFNANITSWDTSKVTNMSNMFKGVKTFNQNIGTWDTSNVTDMMGMFCDAHVFNQDIGEWDVSKVTNMWSMFKNAKSFNQNITSWDISSITGMPSMFDGATSFYYDLSSWDRDELFKYLEERAEKIKYTFISCYRLTQYDGVFRELMNRGNPGESIFRRITSYIHGESKPKFPYPDIKDEYDQDHDSPKWQIGYPLIDVYNKDVRKWYIRNHFHHK
uniref:BspA family leucine-rich repeat surface protein n=1 Tax=Megaviridae environmental sample TaxID=1737588 RepID=A0A5J6VIN8_9VIRU|nr:MAG: protein of unknown function DUF285 [Megaviridae environmental sample]